MPCQSFPWWQILTDMLPGFIRFEPEHWLPKSSPCIKPLNQNSLWQRMKSWQINFFVNYICIDSTKWEANECVVHGLLCNGKQRISYAGTYLVSYCAVCQNQSSEKSWWIRNNEVWTWIYQNLCQLSYFNFTSSETLLQLGFLSSTSSNAEIVEGRKHAIKSRVRKLKWIQNDENPVVVDIVYLYQTAPSKHRRISFATILWHIQNKENIAWTRRFKSIFKPA